MKGHWESSRWKISTIKIDMIETSTNLVKNTVQWINIQQAHFRMENIPKVANY